MATATAPPRKKSKKKDRELDRAARTAQRLDEAKQLVPQIRAEHRAVVDALESGLDHAIRCGEYLTQARKLIRRGEWEVWVQTNCEFSLRTARNYMTVFRRQDELPKREETSYRRAVHMLRRDPAKPMGKKRPAAPSGAKLTISKRALTEAIQTYYADVEKKELLDLLKAIGVMVR